MPSPIAHLTGHIAFCATRDSPRHSLWRYSSPRVQSTIESSLVTSPVSLGISLAIFLLTNPCFVVVMPSAAIRAYLSKPHRDHAGSGCPSAALLPEISRQEPSTRHVYTESMKRLLNALEKQLPDMPRGPKAREIAIGTVGLLIGTLQLARAVDDPSLSEDILAAGTHVASALIQSGKRRT
jgi:hypothetical protein